MEKQYTVQMALLRANLHCAAFKKELTSKTAICARYDQDIYKRKEPEMRYYVDIYKEFYATDMEYLSRTTPSMVITPLLEIFKKVLEERGVTTLEWHWGGHTPTLGMLPIAYFYWLDAGVTLYIKAKR